MKSPDSLQLALAIALHLPLGWLGWRLGFVTPAAAVLGAACGALFLAALGWPGWFLLAMLVGLGFGATALRATWRQNSRAAGERRRAAQVLAKGSVATVAAVLAGVGVTPGLWIAIAAGALSAALADTLGTEVGRIGRGVRPRLPPRFVAVPAGTPGAISLPGTVCAAAGATALGLVGWLAGLLTLPTAAVVAAAGLVASLVESVVIATAGRSRRLTPVGANFLVTLIGATLAGGWMALQ